MVSVPRWPYGGPVPSVGLGTLTVEPAPLPPTPDPEPGDPGTPWVSPTRGPRVQFLAERPDGTPLGEFHSANVRSWSDPLSGASRATVEVSRHDPMWEVVGVGPEATIGGRARRALDAKLVDWLICVDGQREREGFVSTPIDWSGDTITLPMQGGMGLLSGVTLRGGDGDDGWGLRPTIAELERSLDALEGRGNFDGPSPLAGWTTSGGDVSIAVTTDSPLSPPRCMRITGSGTVRGPWVQIPGSPHARAGWLARCAGRLPGDDSSGGDVAVEVERLQGGTWVSHDSPRNESGVWRMDDDDWQVAEGRGFVHRASGAVPHRMRIRLNVMQDPGSHIDVDEVAYLQDSRIGAAGREDLVFLARRVLAGSVFRWPGHRLSWSLRGLTGSEVSMLWYTSEAQSAADALESITARPDGPDVWCTPAWTFFIDPRRGQERHDLVLDDTTVLGVDDLTADPGAQVEDMVTLTSLSPLSLRTAQPYIAGRRRTEATQRAPLASYATQSGWHDGWAAQAAVQQFSGRVWVSWETGRNLATGDTVRAALTNQAGLAHVGWVRVADREMHPDLNAVALDIGTDGTVT